MEKFLSNKIGVATQAISVLLSIGFVSSVLYNYGYFFALGLSINSLPLTLMDYSETALLWLVPVFIVLAFGVMVELVLTRLEGGLTEEEIITSTSNPEKTRKRRDAPVKYIKRIAIAATGMWVIVYILFGRNFYPSFNYLFPLIFVDWWIFSTWLNDHPTIHQRRNKIMRYAIVLLPLIALFMFYRGHETAIDDISNPNATYILHVKDEAAVSKQKQVVLLRNLNRGILVSADKNLEFYSWVDVKKIVMQQKKQGVFFKGVLCGWSNKLCHIKKAIAISN
jgi:hypothetical protein